MWATDIKMQSNNKYWMHQLAWKIYREATGSQERGFCYRRTAKGIRIFSDKAINDTSIKVLFEQGKKVEFMSVFSPTIGTYRDENGNRHRMDLITCDEKAKQKFINRFDGCADFDFDFFQKMCPESVKRPSGQVSTWSCWLVKGTLKINDVDAFLLRATTGVGAGSAFGLGFIETDFKGEI